MIRKKSAIYLVIVTLTVLLVITSCMEPRKGSLNTNLQPYITITNYFGVEGDSLITESQLFQQTVQWSGTDEDGIVEGYAFRVLNENGEPIATPGNDVITEDGWVKFYTPIADQNIPLSESSDTTIWFDQSYATINFPAADANGDSANVVSILEVKCLDNGDAESEVARKYFQAHSNTPSVSVVSTKGAINGETIGTAIVFSFTMLDDDPVVGSLPYYFEYKLEKRDLLNNIITEENGGYADEWISTLEFPDISLSLHSALYNNALITNTLIGDVPQDMTHLRARATDAAMIQSDEVEISFVVKDGFYPGSVIYFGEENARENTVNALGTNHFATFIPEGTSAILPSVQTSDGIHYATPFWYNSESKYSAIGSNDFKIYLKWGYHGEYTEDNPYKKKNDKTLDESTGDEYFCEIVGYDLRLDGAPYFYPPIPADADLGTLQIDDDGTEWLRVYAMFPIYQATTVTLTSLGGGLENLYGEHTFEVRAIDLQGAVDLTPHEYSFTVVPPIPKEEKSGVLIIDDDSDTVESPGDLTDSLYTYIISDYTSEHGYLNRKDLNEWLANEVNLTISNIVNLHDQSIIAPSDIHQYKTIIYHSDNGNVLFDFWTEFEAFKIYLLQGGNIILSGGSNLRDTNVNCATAGYNIFDEYFGIPMNNGDAVRRISTSYSDNPFFIKAISEGYYNDLDLLLPSFNPTITNPYVPSLSKNGLGPIAYFSGYKPEAEVIYTYGCKDVGEDPFQPTQVEYDQFNGLPVALKYETTENSCYIFGFPLSYMDGDQAKSMMTQILNDLP